MATHSQWLFWAMLSAVFAALTAIFAKAGLQNINSDFATLVRTAMILLVLAAFVLGTGKWQPPASVAASTWGWLLASALATGASWVCYFRALQAGDVGPMTGFTNETLGETWELKGDSSDEHALQARAEDYPLGRVPAGALLLTAGVDVQRDRWEIAIWAWGRGLESWAVAHQVIQGNPASEADWEPVTQYLQQRYVQAWHGGSLGLSAISIDSSDQTQSVYNWVRSAQGQLAGLRALTP